MRHNCRIVVRKPTNACLIWGQPCFFSRHKSPPLPLRLLNAPPNRREPPRVPLEVLEVPTDHNDESVMPLYVGLGLACALLEHRKYFCAALKTEKYGHVGRLGGSGRGMLFQLEIVRHHDSVNNEPQQCCVAAQLQIAAKHLLVGPALGLPTASRYLAWSSCLLSGGRHPTTRSCILCLASCECSLFLRQRCLGANMTFRHFRQSV